MTQLILHSGAKPVSVDRVYQSQTPEPTPTHTPLPHGNVIDILQKRFESAGYSFKSMTMGLTDDDAELFGLAEVHHDAFETLGDTTSQIIGFRNSHNKKFSASIAFGARVFVCDNLCFYGEHVLSRRHVGEIELYFSALVQVSTEKMIYSAMDFADTLDDMRATEIENQHWIDHLIMESARQNIIGKSQIMAVSDTFHADRSCTRYGYDWTYWRLYNSFTEVMKPKSHSAMVNLPRRTMNLVKFLGEYVDDKAAAPQALAQTA